MQFCPPRNNVHAIDLLSLAVFFHNDMCQPSHVTRANICRIHSKNTFQWHAPYETQTAMEFIRCATICVRRIVSLYIYYVPVPLSDADVDYMSSMVMQ